MSDNGLKPITATTGSYPTLRSGTVRAAAENSGNVRPEGGNAVPVATQTKLDMEAIARSLNLANKSIGNQLRFEVDLEKGRSVIQVLDRETGEIIRQIPPEQAGSVITGSGVSGFNLYDDQI